jgi:phenylacetate-CoA ligase
VIERGFKARLGPAVQVVVEKLETITPEESGKFRYVVSRVANRSEGMA